MSEEERPALQSRTILSLALGFDDKQVKRDDLGRLSEIMQALGYRYAPTRLKNQGNRLVKCWLKK